MRRKSPKVVWLPQTNANSIGSAFGNVTSSVQQFIVANAGDPGDQSVGEIPVVLDAEGQDPLGNGPISLSDMFNSGYRLRRIVGKVFVAALQEQGSAGPASCICTAGLIVRRIDPTTGTSLALLTGNAEELSPSQIRNASDPWIWRRSWILNNILATAAGTSIAFGASGSTHNWANQSGSALDGPHVDQKTARIVGSEERLFLTVSTELLTSGTDAQTPLNVVVLTDLRVLASLRTNLGNRRNASR